MSIDAKPEIMTLPSDQNATGRTFGAEEIEMLTAAIESGTLTSTKGTFVKQLEACLLYTSPSPRDRTRSRMPSSA